MSCSSAVGRLGSALVLTAVLLVPVPAPAFAADAGNTCATATPIALGASWVSDDLAGATDRDWYRLTITAKRKVLITLGDLTMDATLTLQGACGTTLATSDRPGIQYEEIYRTLAAGTYRLRVTAPPSVAAGRGYDLRVRPIANRVVVLSFSAWAPYAGFPDRPRVVGEVLNASVSVSIESAPIAGYPALTGLVVHPSSVLVDGPIVTYVGTVSNTNGFSVTIPRVMVTIYDARGAVRQAEFQDVEPDPLPAHATTDYAIDVDGRGTGNRVVFSTHGYKNPHG